jgi:hypothetical protein
VLVNVTTVFVLSLAFTDNVIPPAPGVIHVSFNGFELPVRNPRCVDGTGGFASLSGIPPLYGSPAQTWSV